VEVMLVAFIVAGERKKNRKKRSAATRRPGLACQKSEGQMRFDKWKKLTEQQSSDR